MPTFLFTLAWITNFENLKNDSRPWYLRRKEIINIICDNDKQYFLAIFEILKHLRGASLESHLLHTGQPCWFSMKQIKKQIKRHSMLPAVCHLDSNDLNEEPQSRRSITRWWWWFSKGIQCFKAPSKLCATCWTLSPSRWRTSIKANNWGQLHVDTDR